jgi:ferredoxin
MGKIFWFSGTGNSFKAAEKIAHFSRGKYELVRITDTLISSSPVIEDEEIGIVFPVYSWTLPEPVRDFIKASDFRGVKYCFSIATMGGAAGRCGAVLKKMLSRKGVKLSFFDTVVMPDNCIYLFDTHAAKGKDFIDNMLAKCSADLLKIGDKINSRTESVNISRKTIGWLLTYIVGSLFPKQYKGFDKKFNVSDSCTGCGICHNVCPVSNIIIENGKPVYQGRCIICMGCINWCPENAINYKNKTLKRTRYHHPGVKYSDLL